MKISLTSLGLFCSLVLLSSPVFAAKFEVKILQTPIYSGDSSDLDQYEVHLLPDGAPVYLVRSRFLGYSGINQEFTRTQKEVEVSESFHNDLPLELKNTRPTVHKDEAFQLEISRLFLDHRFDLSVAATKMEEIRVRLEKETAKLQEQININALHIQSLKESTARFKMVQSERALKASELKTPTTKTTRHYGFGRGRSKL